MRSARTAYALLAICGSSLVLGGCAVAIGAGALVGADVAHDRRSTGTQIDDEIIELKIEDLIRRDSELWNQCHIDITSFDNVVLLTGEAPTEALRKRVVEYARKVPKVRVVHDEITIAAPSSMLSRTGDAWITSKVKAVLFTQEKFDATRVKVITENGVVYLMGLVTQAEASKATDVARHVDGVQRVVKVFEYLKS